VSKRLSVADHPKDRGSDLMLPSTMKLSDGGYATYSRHNGIIIHARLLIFPEDVSFIEHDMTETLSVIKECIEGLPRCI
jgi:hypothetical protein